MILPCCGGGNRQASVADGMVHEKNRPQIPPNNRSLRMNHWSFTP